MLPDTDPSRFGSALSRVLFIDRPGEGAVAPAAAEERLLAAVCRLVDTAPEEDLHAMCYLLNQAVIPRLCGESVLRLAQVIERRASWMFINIPRLAAYKGRLRRAADLAQTFHPANLARLAGALEEELARK